MRTVIGLGMVLAAIAGVSVSAAAPAELESLAFLLGEWSASGADPPGQARGTATFTRFLQDRVILRTSFAEHPAARLDDGVRTHRVLALRLTRATGKWR